MVSSSFSYSWGYFFLPCGGLKTQWFIIFSAAMVASSVTNDLSLSRSLFLVLLCYWSGSSLPLTAVDVYVAAVFFNFPFCPGDSLENMSQWLSFTPIRDLLDGRYLNSLPLQCQKLLWPPTTVPLLSGSRHIVFSFPVRKGLALDPPHQIVAFTECYFRWTASFAWPLAAFARRFPFLVMA